MLESLARELLPVTAIKTVGPIQINLVAGQSVIVTEMCTATVRLDNAIIKANFFLVQQCFPDANVRDQYYRTPNTTV